MIVASDTSPLTSLAAIGQFELLRTLYGEIHIAQGVELNPGGRRPPRRRRICRHLYLPGLRDLVGCQGRIALLA